MKKVYYCHKDFEPGFTCALRRKDGTCVSLGTFDCRHRGITPKVKNTVPPPPKKPAESKNNSKGDNAMKDKFTMELVWHNCATCPPKEDFNANLCLTNGRTAFGARHDKGEWYDREFDVCIPHYMLSDFWWADIVQTINGVANFNVGD